jgi:hypothetical protein
MYLFILVIGKKTHKFQGLKEKVKLSHLVLTTNPGNYRSTAVIPHKVKISRVTTKFTAQ